MIRKLILKQGMISSALTALFLVLSLVIVGLQVDMLGVENYGIIVILFSVFGTINLINAGVGSALVTHYSSAEKSGLFWKLFFWVFLVFLILALAIISVGAVFHSTVFTLLSLSPDTLDISVYWGAALVGISRLLMNIVACQWVARVNFFASKTFNFVSFNLPLLVVLALYAQTSNLNDAIFGAGVVNIVFIIAAFASVLIKNAKSSSFVVPKADLAKLLRTAFEFQGISILSSLGRPLINTLINHQFGLAYTAYFDVAFRLLSAGRQVIVTATEPFFSITSQLNHKKKAKMIYLLIKKYTAYLALVALAYVAGMWLLSGVVLYYWVGQEVMFHTVPIVRVLSVGLAFNIATAVIYHSMLSSRIGRLHIFIHQFIIIAALIAMYFIDFEQSQTLIVIHSASYIISALYLVMAMRYIHQKCKLV